MAPWGRRTMLGRRIERRTITVLASWERGTIFTGSVERLSFAPIAASRRRTRLAGPFRRHSIRSRPIATPRRRRSRVTGSVIRPSIRSMAREACRRGAVESRSLGEDWRRAAEERAHFAQSADARGLTQHAQGKKTGGEGSIRRRGPRTQVDERERERCAESSLPEQTSQ